MAEEEAVGLMKAMFPDVGEAMAVEVLEACGGSVEHAVDHMLIVMEHAGGRGFGSAPGREQILSVGSSPMVSTPDTLRQAAAAGEGSSPGDGVPDRLEETVRTIKEIVLPALQRQVAGLEMPNIEKFTDRLSYKLTNVQVKTFEVDPSCVRVDIEGSRINVHVEKLRIELDVGSWYFEKRTRPRLRDTGSAHVLLGDVRADLTLIEEPDPRTPFRVQDDCKVEVGKVALKTMETRAAWLYNALALVLRPALKSAAEHALQASITDAVQEQVRDWGSWMYG